MDEKQFQDIFNFAEENLKIPVWKYNGVTLKLMIKRVIDYRVDLSNEPPEGKIGCFSFTKDMPYIMDLAF